MSIVFGSAGAGLRIVVIPASFARRRPTATVSKGISNPASKTPPVWNTPIGTIRMSSGDRRALAPGATPMRFWPSASPTKMRAIWLAAPATIRA